MPRIHIRSGSNGFTIVELLIALAVFSLVLVVVTASIIQISRVYYKGVTETNVQATARSIIDTVSQSIQFSGGKVTDTPAVVSAGSSYDFCINNQEYSYRPGYKLVDSTPGTNETNHALISRTVSACSSPTGQLMSGAVTGRELLSPNTRLANMVVKNVGPNLYQIQVRIVYGDDDLLSNPTAANASCKGIAGRQFCAVSDLSTVVISRVK
ncbi:MAG TPA: prepilin-type N-terminal cleavage/methylation domain-containing protein [Candidatus Saccharimonadales bacterium]|jgi:prepilin-type N-terminal cleavage/methylation domain-containing protein|nr:prepilin-type N-terminal cleavage/methylation domain-containing protein [Candidatus Saccharimonadales bacterium]